MGTSALPPPGQTMRMGPLSAGNRPLAIHRALGDESRLRIVALLREELRPFDVREIATAVALHPNTVRDHLNVLLEAGLVRTRPEKRDRAGRPRVLYEADKRSDQWLIPLDFERLPEEEALARSRAFLDLMSRRRSVREFARDPVPRELVENAIRTATTAPSGANKQPWHFVVVADPAIKAEIRAAAEHEEELFYAERANKEYLRAIEPMGVTPVKSHLTDAPYLIAIFQQPWALNEQGRKETHYYARESVGIALGFLLAALHAAGLATLPYAPAPMRFLNRILRRPENERPFLLVAVGYPAHGAQVPALPRKPTSETVDFV
jgi:iodotyrosine deiodinase